MLIKVKFCDGSVKQKNCQGKIEEIVGIVLTVLQISSIDKVTIFYIDSSLDLVKIQDQDDLDACFEDCRIVNGLNDLKNIKVTLRAAFKETPMDHSIFRLEADSLMVTVNNISNISNLQQNLSILHDIKGSANGAILNQTGMNFSKKNPTLLEPEVSFASTAQNPAERKPIQERPSLSIRSSSLSAIKSNSNREYQLQSSFFSQSSQFFQPQNALADKKSSTPPKPLTTPADPEQPQPKTIAPTQSRNIGSPNSPNSGKSAKVVDTSHKCKQYRYGYLPNKWKQREVWDQLDQMLLAKKGLHISVELYEEVYSTYWSSHVQNRSPANNPQVVQLLYRALELDGVFDRYILSLKNATITQ